MIVSIDDRKAIRKITFCCGAIAKDIVMHELFVYPWNDKKLNFYYNVDK